MSKKNSFTRSISKFVKGFDFFGVNLYFQFKDDDKYKSTLGGSAYLIFLLCSTVYLAINFKEFVSRTSFSLVYNEGISDVAPKMNFTEYEVGLAVGLRTDDILLSPMLYQYLDMTFNLVTLEKTEGAVKKTRDRLALTKCNYSHFYNQVNKSFDDLDLKNYYCPDLRNHIVQGIYTEDVFKYFEFVVAVKPQYLNDIASIQKLFEQNEMRAELYYLDTSITSTSYEKPLNKFLNSQFNYIDLRFYKKKNLDFTVYDFVSDNNIFMSDESNKNHFISLGRIQDNFNDIGDDRLTKKGRDYNLFSKIYVRSSNTYREVNRTYLKITQYLADMSGLLSLVTLLLIFFFQEINNFKAQQAILKKIFKFKENMTYKNIETIHYLKEKFEVVKEDIPSFELKDNNDRNYEEGKEVEESPIGTDRMEREVPMSPAEVTLKFDLKDRNPVTENYETINNQSPIIRSLKRAQTFKIKIPSHVKTLSCDNLVVDTKRTVDNLTTQKEVTPVRFDFSVCEIIYKYACPCLPNRSIRQKSELLKKGLGKLTYNMNVLTYIRKMQEVDILKYILLNKDQITLLNFLSKPSVSLVSSNEHFESLYKIFNVEINKEEVDKINEALKNIVDHNLNEPDKKLLDLVGAEIDNLIQ